MRFRDPAYALVRRPRRPSRAAGRVVAVWGPAGAPGRTTVAIGVADEAARLGVSTLLADADPYGGTVAQTLGLLDESAGLALASPGRGGRPARHRAARPAEPAAAPADCGC